MCSARAGLCLRYDAEQLPLRITLKPFDFACFAELLRYKNGTTLRSMSGTMCGTISGQSEGDR